MNILYIRTDKPQAEITVATDNERKHVSWEAGRELSNQILRAIDGLCSDVQITAHDITAVCFYSGPGSYTGLRIGASVAQAIAWGNTAACVAASGDDWQNAAQQQLTSGATEKFKKYSLTIEYGGNTRVTQQKK